MVRDATGTADPGCLISSDVTVSVIGSAGRGEYFQDVGACWEDVGIPESVLFAPDASKLDGIWRSTRFGGNGFW